MTELTRRASTVESAIAAALQDLGVTRDEVTIEVIEPGRKGFLGIGAKEAEVKVTVIEQEPIIEEEEPAAPAAEPAPVEETPVEEPEQEEVESSEQLDEPVREQPEPMIEEEEPTQISAISKIDEEEAPAYVTDEEAIEQTKQYISDVAREMGITDLSISHEVDGKYITFQLDSKKAAYLIGKRGTTLNAIQQLAQLVANKLTRHFKVIRVDVADYRERRERSLEQLAERMADRAVRTRRKVTLEPMPSYERKVIHHALSSRLDIETYSEGTDPHRYIVIKAIQ